MSKVPHSNLGFLLGDVSRLMRSCFQAKQGADHLSLAQARALVYIARHEGLRQIDLAQMLEIQPITLTKLIDRLVADELVERRSVPGDRRAYNIFLAPAAKAQLAEIENTAAQVRKQALKGLTAAEAETLLTALEKIRANLSVE